MWKPSLPTQQMRLKPQLRPERSTGTWKFTASFVGYFRGHPRCIYADFSPNTGRAKVAEVRLRPGWKDLKSSPKIVAAFERNDPRLAQFRKPFDRHSSLQEAADFAEGFIQASCYLPATHFIDSEFTEYFAGRIHVATVTPPDRSLKSRILRCLGRGRPQQQQTGFHWLKPPILS